MHLIICCSTYWTLRASWILMSISRCVWEVFSHYSFKYILCPFPFPSGITVMKLCLFSLGPMNSIGFLHSFQFFSLFDSLDNYNCLVQVTDYFFYWLSLLLKLSFEFFSYFSALGCMFLFFKNFLFCSCIVFLFLFSYLSVYALLWRKKWQPTPVFLPGESQGWGSLVGCCRWGRTESDTTEATQQQQQHALLNFLQRTILNSLNVHGYPFLQYQLLELYYFPLVVSYLPGFS